MTYSLTGKKKPAAEKKAAAPAAEPAADAPKPAEPKKVQKPANKNAKKGAVKKALSAQTRVSWMLVGHTCILFDGRGMIQVRGMKNVTSSHCVELSVNLESAETAHMSLPINPLVFALFFLEIS